VLARRGDVALGVVEILLQRDGERVRLADAVRRARAIVIFAFGTASSTLPWMLLESEPMPVTTLVVRFLIVCCVN
jgi:hypothetical protein